MNVMILGLGVIGTTYGYALQKAGHTVETFIRESKRAFAPGKIKIKLLDGRGKQKGQKTTDHFLVTSACSGSNYDYIIISVSSGKLESAVQTIIDNRITGTIILMNGIWEDKLSLDKMMQNRPYILGFPVAGGKQTDGLLDCVLFDHIMLESKERSGVPDYEEIISLFQSADIKAEIPYDMLEWIWIHMAVNAGVITTAAKYGDVSNPSEAAEHLMNSSKALGEAVRSIRETVRIVSSRNVKLNRYRNELLPYSIPSPIAGIMMKKMFAGNELTREIMELHSNQADLLYVCRSVFECGKKNHVKAEIFYENFQRMDEALCPLKGK